MPQRAWTTCLLVFVVVIAGCGGTASDPSPTPSPAPPEGATATVQASPTPTTAPMSSPTPTPTRSPSPTATATPSSTPTPAPEQAGTLVTVYEVVDGDTLKIRYQNGTKDTLRLLGVDTPEVHTDNDPAEFEGVPNTNAGEACLREEGHDASDFMKQRVAGEEVRIEFDAQADRRGSFGRLLVYVSLGSTNLNYQLVAEGYARVYDSTFTQSDRFYSAESDARSRQIGLWRCRKVATPTPTPTPAPDGDGSGHLAVAVIHEDAEGNDHENLNDEYIVFENTGGETLDLSGWTIRDDADHTYTVPDGVTLAPGDEITLYTGSGSDSSTELYWRSDSAIWNNGGDTIIVEDANGEEVLRHEYS